MITRRSVLLGLSATLAMPAIVRASSIWVPPRQRVVVPELVWRIYYMGVPINMRQEGYHEITKDLRPSIGAYDLATQTLPRFLHQAI